MKPTLNGLSRQALPSLKPRSPHPDSPSDQLSPVESVGKDPLDEICDLRHQLLLEKSKHMELRQQVNEMTQFFAKISQNSTQSKEI
jgi:hypothetical protein